ncbi:MAG: hypothetical protein IKO05_12050 [Selenomonadaceae bacterium]|nr:hypothetical protein [Selenomonadaceae bacterium]
MTPAEYIVAKDRWRELRESGHLDEQQLNFLGEVLYNNRPREMKVVDLSEYRERRRTA